MNPMEKNYVLNHIFIGIQKNSEEEIVKRKSNLEGLETYLYIREEIDSTHMVGVKVTSGYLKTVGLPEESAWIRASDNSCSETMLSSLSRMIAEMTDTLYEEENDVNPIYVVTNTKKQLGASAILDKHVLERIGQKHKTNQLIILPSSIHEMLVVPYTYGFDLESMTEMVRDVNDAIVAPKERLTDQAYIIEI